MNINDSDAIRRVLAGNRDAYRVLMDRHFQAVFRVTFRITGDARDAEEAAQDAFLRAYTRLDSCRQEATFSTWITRIAMNTALNLVERRKYDVIRSASPGPGSNSSTREVQLADHTAGPERLLLNAEAAVMRRAAMDNLTPMERAAFTMRHMEEISLAEIGEALDLPVNSVKQAIFRAVSKLRHSLAPLAGGLR